MSKSTISIKEIGMLPSPIGEPDVLRAFQLMPGIQGGQEGSNGLYVRGGTPDQNLFLLDDVPLYNVNHLGGFVSVFDNSMLKSIDIHKGGFPARYGGRLSSIVDIRLKDGNMKELHGEIGVGVVLTKIMLEGPLKKDVSSFGFSFRRCNFDLLTYAQQFLIPDPSAANERYGYTFHDLNFKWNYKLTMKDRIHISAYLGNDKTRFVTKKTEIPFGNYYYSSKNIIKWGNIMLSTRWNHVYSNRLFHNFTIAYTQYKYKNSSNFQREGVGQDNFSSKDEYLFYSGINDIIAKTDFEYTLNKHTFRSGAAVITHDFTPAFSSYSSWHSNLDIGDTLLNSPEKSTKVNAFESSIYFEYEATLSSKLKTNIGINSSVYIVENTNYFLTEPRLLINYLLTSSISVKASYSRMHQYTHLLSNSGVGLPTDLWVPSTATIKPETADQFAIGLAHTGRRNIEYSLEAYHKRMDNLIEYKAGSIMFNDAEAFTNKIELNGEGISKGLEFLVQKKTGKLSGWLGYTLSKTERKFNNLNNGQAFPYKYDRRHDLSIVANWQLKPNITFSSTWVYNSGHALTLPTSKYQLRIQNSSVLDQTPDDGFYDVDIHIYNGKNKYRMPAYHRLDVGFRFSKQKPKGVRTWSLGVYNLYNQQNPYFVYFKKEPIKLVDESGGVDVKNENRVKLYQMTLMPIFPYLSYSFVF